MKTFNCHIVRVAYVLPSPRFLLALIQNKLANSPCRKS